MRSLLDNPRNSANVTMRCHHETSPEAKWYLTLSRESTPHLSGNEAYVIGIVGVTRDFYTGIHVRCTFS